MRVGKYAKHDVATISGSATIQQAVTLMGDRHVGDLVVVRGHDDVLTPVGVITDRDVVLKVVRQGLVPAQTKVSDAMSTPAVVVSVDDQLTDALRVMSDRGVRRAPVVDHRGLLRGIVTLDDLIGVIAAELVRVTRLIGREQGREAARTVDPAHE